MKHTNDIVFGKRAYGFFIVESEQVSYDNLTREDAIKILKKLTKKNNRNITVSKAIKDADVEECKCIINTLNLPTYLHSSTICTKESSNFINEVNDKENSVVDSITNKIDNKSVESGKSGTYRDITIDEKTITLPCKFSEIEEFILGLDENDSIDVTDIIYPTKEKVYEIEADGDVIVEFIVINDTDKNILLKDATVYMFSCSYDLTSRVSFFKDIHLIERKNSIINKIGEETIVKDGYYCWNYEEIPDKGEDDRDLDNFSIFFDNNHAIDISVDCSCLFYKNIEKTRPLAVWDKKSYISEPKNVCLKVTRTVTITLAIIMGLYLFVSGVTSLMLPEHSKIKHMKEGYTVKELINLRDKLLEEDAKETYTFYYDYLNLYNSLLKYAKENDLTYCDRIYSGNKINFTTFITMPYDYPKIFKQDLSYEKVTKKVTRMEYEIKVVTDEGILGTQFLYDKIDNCIYNISVPDMLSDDYVYTIYYDKTDTSTKKFNGATYVYYNTACISRDEIVNQDNKKISIEQYLSH